jgi:hypothetical protein
MNALFKYAIVLSLGLAVGFIVKEPLNLGDVAKFKWLDEITVILNKALVSAKPAADVVPIDPAAAALIDEELDYRIAQRIGSLEGWRSFLAAHGSSAHAQSARVEAQVLGGKSSAQAVAETSNGASTDAKAANEVVSSVPAEAQVLAGKAPAQVAAEVSNGPSTDAKAGSEAVPSVPPSAGTEVAALTPDEICKRDGDRLERLRSSPTSEEAARFANELGCEKLRPQLLGLMGSLGYAAPTPPAAEASNGAPTHAKAGTEVVGTEYYRATKETDPEVARKNSVARHALAYSWVTTDAAGHRWVHIRPIHYSQEE